MKIIKNIPWKALGIMTLGFIIGMYFGAKGAANAIVKVFNSESVSKSINKPTNENNTTVKFEHNKFKKNDTVNIVVSQKPSSSQSVNSILDSCVVNKAQYSSFSKGERNKIDRWIKRFNTNNI